MTKRRTVADAGAVGTRASHANGPTGQVSRSVILHCALRIVDRDGVDGLSVRRLSEQVGRDPRSCSGSYGWIPRISTGRLSCAVWPTTSVGWRWRTQTSCLSW